MHRHGLAILRGSISLGLIVALIIMSGACLKPASNLSTTSTSPAPEGKERFELTLANQHPLEDNMNRIVFQSWINWLDKASDGRIKINLLPAGNVAKPSGFYDAARTGVVDISDQALSYVPGRFPLLEVVNLPLIFDFPASKAAAMTCMELYEKYPEIRAELGDLQEVKVLCIHASGPAQVNTVEKQVRTWRIWKGKP